MTLGQLAIIIPAYNEKDSLSRVLNKIETYCCHIPFHVYLVVDSPDDSSLYYAKRSKLDSKFLSILVQNAIGPAHAIKFAIEAVTETLIVVLTADDTDDVCDLPIIYEKLTSGSVLVSASRYVLGGKFEGGPILKRLLSVSASKLLEVRHGIIASDPTNGYKGFSKDLYLTGVRSHKSGFTYGLQMLLYCLKKKLVISVIPTNWHDRKEGASSFKVLRWLPSYTYWFIRIMFVK
jgi:dolichol-phosphate mannosyltransferase